MAKVKTANGPKTQEELDTLFKLAISLKDGKAIEKLKKLMERGEIHFPPNSQTPVLGAAPKVEQAVDAAENLATGPASKKKLTAADRAEMKAAEKRAQKVAAAQKVVDQKALEDLEKKRAADKEASDAAREKAAAEEAKKPTASVKQETKTSAAEQAEAQQSLEQARAKKQAPKEGFEVAKPSRQEQQAKMEAMKRGAKKTPTVEGIAKKTVEPGASAEDRLKGLRAKNFKEEWGRSTKAVRDRVLRNTFGPQALSLNVATQNKLGELAFARQAFEQSGLQSLPDMDDKLKSFDTLVESIKDSAVRDPKGVEQRVANLHGKMLTATGGKLRVQDLEFRKPRPGEVGSDKPKPENPVKKVSPGFETAKRAQVPVEARNLAAAAKKKPMDAGAPAAAAAAEETPTAPSGKKPMDTGVSEPVPSTPTGKRPMDAGPAPKTAAAPGAAAPAAEATKSPYMQTVLADPAKYGAQKDRATWTKEQKAARKALADQLGLNTPEARAAKKAADAAADPEMAEVKKRYGEAVRSNPSKYGRSNKKATDAQKAAKKDLFSKLTEQVKAEFAAKTPVAAASAAPTAPVKPSAGKAAAPTGTLADILGPTKMGAPAAPAAPPTAPTTAPAPTTPAPAAAAATGAVEKKKAGPWKKGAMRSGLGARKGAEAVKQRLGQITGGTGAGGAMRFLGPLFGAFAAYQLLDMARQGTVGEADQRRMKALESLGAVSGGMQQDAASREQMRQMQRMVDLAAIQRQQALDQMRQQYTGDQALDAILRGQQSSLAALAVPSQPSIAEMMARY